MEISLWLFVYIILDSFWNVYELVFMGLFVLCFKFSQIKQTNKYCSM